MQAQPQPKPPVGIVYDTGLQRISDVLALALLYGLDGKNESRLLGISVEASNLKAAAFCEAVAQFYAGPPTPFGPRYVPIGLSLAGKFTADAPMFSTPLDRKDDQDKPAYRFTIRKLNDSADPVAVLRNALTTQPDGNAVVVLAGPATSLANLLALRAAQETLATKPKLLVIAAGSYPDGTDAYIQADVAAMRKVLADWPTPIVACGSEVGAALPFSAASVEKDFAWSPAHPVVDAYRAHRAMPYDAPTESMAAALYVARPSLFHLSEPGKITVADNGATKFTPVTGGTHRYLMVDPAQKESVIKAYTELASAKPVVRQRQRPPQ